MVYRHPWWPPWAKVPGSLVVRLCPRHPGLVAVHPVGTLRDRPGAAMWRRGVCGGYGRGTSARSMIRSQEPSGWRRRTCTRTPVLSAERVEVSARSSNLTVGSEISTANFTPRIDYVLDNWSDLILAADVSVDPGAHNAHVSAFAPDRRMPTEAAPNGGSSRAP